MVAGFVHKRTDFTIEIFSLLLLVLEGLFW